MRQYLFIFIFLLSGLTWADREHYVKNQLIVRMKSSFGISSYSNNFLGHPITSMKSLWTPKTIKTNQFTARSQPCVITFSTDQDIPKLIEEFKKHPEIESVQPNFILYPSGKLIPNDQKLPGQYHIELLNLPDTWEILRGSSTTNIAIIDTGIDLTHEDLVDKIWHNPGEIPNNSIDDDHNGLIDDSNGWNFGGENNNVSDTDGHGTHVSGIAAANTNNTIGVAGVGFNTHIMAIKASGLTNTFTNSALIDAIRYAVHNGAKIINMSLGGEDTNPDLEAAVNDAYNQGVTIVVAAGNESKNVDTTPVAPAYFENVITVSACTASRNFDSSYSNFGPSISLMAPGTHILSTYKDNQYARLTGTSMASPMVAGIAGLFLSQFPNLTNQELYTLLTTHATDIAPTGRDEETGFGLINPFLALQGIIPISNFSKATNDFIQTDTLLTITFDSINPIVENTITLTIEGDATTYTTQHSSHALSLSGNTLTIDLSRLTLPQQNSITLTLSVTDTNNKSGTKIVTYQLENQFRFTGPDGSSAKILNAPNPFNPKKESTKIGFQLSQTAHVKATIYTLSLKPVFKLDTTYPTGYQEIIWDGRDLTGDLVPNGVYVAILSANNNGKTIVKKTKIAVVR
ncbi:MAG: hypothetical protein EXS67_06210 [Candidatus Margulisbacteria bacterium]|nr:hypothetical protein [Candidatus Margulisiibacteriota bacterium]